MIFLSRVRTSIGSRYVKKARRLKITRAHSRVSTVSTPSHAFTFPAAFCPTHAQAHVRACISAQVPHAYAVPRLKSFSLFFLKLNRGERCSFSLPNLGTGFPLWNFASSGGPSWVYRQLLWLHKKKQDFKLLFSNGKKIVSNVQFQFIFVCTADSLNKVDYVK